jgi:F420-dependent oxidoreductase-like protein
MTPGGKSVVLVAAIAENGVIGAGGRLPWHLPDDLRHFRALTTGNVVVMGRRTFETIGRPLPRRTTVVVTRQPGWAADGVVAAGSLEAALAAADEHPGDAMVVGGAEVYAAALPLAERMVLTEVHQRPEGDVRFPAYDRGDWTETRREPHDAYDLVWLERRPNGHGARMDLRVFTEPQQGATYDDLLAVARTAEELGYGAFFRSDHYLGIGLGANEDGLPGSTDAWTTLAGLARDTSTMRLGTLVTSATFRLPGPLAITVAQVDRMSGGRVELGLGAGWFEAEHSAYGIPFPPAPERFDRLEEQLEIITGLWTTPVGERFGFEGRHYRLTDSPALPKPLQAPRPPVIIGGYGKRRTPALAARFADEFNLPFASVDTTREQFARVRAACETAGRDPASLVWSNALVVCVGADDQEFRRRAAAIARDPDELRETGVAGTPGEAVETLARYAAEGSQRVYLQVLDLADLEHLHLVAEEVRPHA